MIRSCCAYESVTSTPPCAGTASRELERVDCLWNVRMAPKASKSRRTTNAGRGSVDTGVVCPHCAWCRRTAML